MQAERRRKRTSYYALALHYWLAAEAARFRMFGLVLADAAGLLVASSFRGPEAEELAALAPLLVRNGGDGKRPVPGAPLSVQRLTVDGSTLYLCAVGRPLPTAGSLDDAAQGIHRILTV
ncbi:MAG: hypothetical protein IT371_11495 [Deltaproteobacteria bacterium]|nr:hypothetical protein [Deltaproteobacteria bacterium]